MTIIGRLGIEIEPLLGGEPFTMENNMPLTAEQYARLELVKLAVSEHIPADQIAKFVDHFAAVVLAAPTNEAA